MLSSGLSASGYGGYAVVTASGVCGSDSGVAAAVAYARSGEGSSYSMGEAGV